MRFLRVLILGFAVLLGFSKAAAGAGFTIVDLGVASIVDDGSSGMSDVVGEFITDSPAQGTLFASVGLSTAETQYDFAWTSSLGQFLVTASHEAEDVDSSTLFSASTGSIWVAASQDVLVTLQANYDYVAPATGFFTRIILNIWQEDAGLLFADNDRGGPWVLEPAVGTLTIEEQTVLLPAAGAPYNISYELSTTSFASGTGIIATADGNVAIALQTVPEPTTLSLLALGSLCLLRRRLN